MGTATPKLHRTVEDLTLSVKQEIHVKASIEKTFESLLAELGPEGVRPDGMSNQMKIEPWAGGRWWLTLLLMGAFCFAAERLLLFPVRVLALENARAWGLSHVVQ